MCAQTTAFTTCDEYYACGVGQKYLVYKKPERPPGFVLLSLATWAVTVKPKAAVCRKNTQDSWLQPNKDSGYELATVIHHCFRRAAVEQLGSISWGKYMRWAQVLMVAAHIGLYENCTISC